MIRRLVVAVVVVVIGSGCGDDPSCTLPAQWSSARSGDGSTCQVNIFAPSEHSTYCGGSAGNWSCACGPLVENPLEFVSTDFCDLEAEDRVCQAIARCGFAL